MVEAILLDKTRSCRARCTCRASTAYGTCSSACRSSSAPRGVEQIIEIKLTPEEDAAFKKSAAAVKELVDVIKRLGDLLMSVHEYQAKAILARHGVPVPRGEVAFTAAEAGEIASRLGGGLVVVKAQIHAGGRGKGGGVKLAKSRDEAEALAGQMLGMTLVTHQTGPSGRWCSGCSSRGRCRSPASCTSSLVLDRAAGKPLMMASAAGGMDIEEVAAKTPEKIVRVYIEPGVGLVPFQARRLAFGIGLDGGAGQPSSSAFPRALYEAFVATDASLVEINPLVVTDGGRSAGARRQDGLRRQRALPPPDIRELRDLDEEDPLEIEARSSRSTTSASTATSAAWSTAPAWRWRRWTSSSWRAASRPTSSTSAAAPTRSRSGRPSRS